MDIKNFIKDNLLHEKGYLLSTKINTKFSFYKENIVYFNKIYKMTSKVPQETPLKERIWLILNDLDDIPKCPNCGKNCSFNKVQFKKGYSKFCSISCSKKECTNNIDINIPLKQFIFKYIVDDNKIIKKNYKQYLINSIESKLRNIYTDVNDIREVIYLYVNDLKEVPKCLNCNRPSKFTNSKVGYQKYCSMKCNNSSSDRVIKIKKTKKERYGNSNYNNINKYKKTMEEKYGVPSPLQSKIIKEKIEKTMIDKYGVDHPSKSETIRKKVEDTNIKKYGHKTNLIPMKEEIKKIWIEKYGVDHPGKSEIVKEKRFKTNIKKYGAISPFSNKDIRNKIKKTNINKYGVDNPSKNNIIKQKINRSIIKTSLKKYGVKYPILSKHIKNKIISINMDKYGTKYPFESKIVQNRLMKMSIKQYGTLFFKQKHIKNYSQWIDNNKFIEVYNRLEFIEDICNYFNVTNALINRRARKLNLLYKSRRKDVTIKNIGKTIEYFSYNIEYNNRTIIKPLELDIVIRKNSKIIKTLEYNGLMFHSLGISEHKVFNNWDKYKDNIEQFINRDKVKLNKCKKLNIELLLLREDIYLNNPNIIDMWLNGKLKYNVLEEPIIYRFKNINKLETIQYRVYNSNYTNSHCRRPNKIWSSCVLREIEDSIDSGYRIYFDWIEIKNN